MRGNRPGGIFLLRQRIARQFLFSYVVVFMMPLLLAFGYLMTSSQRTLMDQVSEAQRLTVNQFAELFEGELKKSRSTALLVDNSLYMESLLYANPENLTNNQYLEIVQFSKELNNMSIQQSISQTMYVYMDSLKRCMEYSSYLSMQSLFERVHGTRQDDLAYEDWLEMLAQNHRETLWAVPRKGSDALDQYALYFLQSLPMLPPHSTLGTLVIQWDTQYLLSLMGASVLDGDTALAVMDAQGDVLLCSRYRMPLEISPLELAGAGTVQRDGYSVSYQWSENRKYLYISMQPEAQILKPLRVAQATSIGVLLLCLCVGLVLTYGFTLRNANPIDELFALARRVRGQRESSGESSYSDISMALMEALDQQATAEALDLFVRELSQSNMLLQALRAPVSDETRVWELLRAQGEPAFAQGACVALQVLMTDYTQGFFQERSLTDEFFHFLMILRDVFLQKMKHYGDVLALVQDDGLYLFVGAPDTDALKTSINNAEGFLRENYALDCKTRIGRPIRAESTPQLLRAALQAVEQGTQIQPMQDWNRSDMNRKIYETAELHEENQRRAALLALAARIEWEEKGDIFWQAVRACECIKDLERLLQDAVEKKNGQEARTADIMPGEDQADEPSEAFLLKQRAIDLVNERYTDPNLNISAIAETLQVDVAQLSRAVKQTTYIGLLDYIHHTRVSAARELLVSQQMTLQQVAERVGYTNVDSFIRAFKRIMNMTPGKYRNKAKSIGIDEI